MANIIQTFPNAGGGGETTPIATAEIAGKVKPDGTTVTIESDGTIHAVGGNNKGGHTIQNESGTAMTARTNLKIVGADVSDDSANSATVIDVSNKVDKVQGKGLSTEDYTTEEKTKLANITLDIDNKVDKVEGKGLSTNDYTTEEKTKLAGLSNYNDTALAGRVSDIEEVIPSTATAENKLATMEDVAGIATDYDTLDNKPQIAGTTLSGDKSLSDLGIQPSTLTTSKTIEGASVTTVQGVADATQTHTDKNVTDANGVHGFKADVSSSRHDILYKSGNQWKTLNLKYLPQFDEMPEAIVGNVGIVIQYIGTTTNEAPIYKHGYVYECIASTVDDVTTYSWKNIELFDVQKVQQEILPEPSAEEFGNIYQYTGTSTPEYINGYYYECILDGSTYTWTEKRVQSAIGQVIQYDSMPIAKGSNVDRIIQYTGNSTEEYTNGYFYKCVAQGTDPETYKWQQTNVQPTSEGMSYEVVTELPTENIDIDTVYSIQPIERQAITNIGPYSNTFYYTDSNYTFNYNSSVDIPKGTILTIDTTRTTNFAVDTNIYTYTYNVVINNVSYQMFTDNAHTGQNTDYNKAVEYTLPESFVANRDKFTIHVNKQRGNPQTTVTIKSFLVKYFLVTEYMPYINVTGDSDGWRKLCDDGGGGGVDKEDKFRFATMPNASVDNLGQVVQYLGATTSVAPIYTNGYFYKCVAQGTDPETYAWEAVSVQAGGGGADSRIKPEILEFGVHQSGAILTPYIKVSYELPSINQLTMDEIIDYVNAYYNGDLSLTDIQENWLVGQYTSLTLDAMPAYSTGVNDSGHPSQIVQPMLVAINHYDISEDEDNRKALLTFYTKDCLNEVGLMDNKGTGGYDEIRGWKNQPRRDWCNDIVYNAFPQNIKSEIKAVVRNVQGANNYGSSENVVDYVFFPEAKEIGDNQGGGTAYGYFDTNAKRVKNVDGVASQYWLGNDSSVGGGYHCEQRIVDTDGTFKGRRRGYEFGLAFGFCI